MVSVLQKGFLVSGLKAGDAHLLRIVGIVLSGVLVALVILIGVLQFVGWSSYKGVIESIAGWTLSRKVKINGDIDGKLFPNVKISASGVVIGGKEEGRYDRLARVGNFSISLPFMSIVRMEPRVENISLNDAKVWIEPQAKEKEEEKREHYLPEVKEASFSDVEIHYYLPDKNMEVTGRIDSFEVGKDGRSGLRLEGKGALSEVPVSVSGSVPDLEDLEAMSDPHPLSIRLSVAEDNLDISGKVVRKDKLNLDVSYKLEGDSLARILKQFGYEAGEVPPYSSRGKISGTLEKVVLDPFHVTLGYSYGSGSFSINRKVETRVQGQMHFDRLLYQDIQSLFPEKEEVKEKELFSDEPFRFSLPDNLSVRVDVSGSRIELLAEENFLDAAEFQLVVKDGNVMISPLVLETEEGLIEGGVTIEIEEKGLTAGLQADLRGIGLSTLVAPLNERLEKLGITDLADGTLNGVVSLSAEGNSVAQLMASLDGQVQVAVEDGYLNATAVEVLGLDLGEFLLSALAGDPKTSIKCGIVDIEADNGILKTGPVVVSTNDTNIILKGRINLEKETVDLTLDPRARDFSILTGGSPIHLSGSLSDLTVRPDEKLGVQLGLGILLGIVLGPMAAPLAFIEPGTAQEDLCSQYLAKLESIKEKAKPS